MKRDLTTPASWESRGNWGPKSASVTQASLTCGASPATLEKSSPEPRTAFATPDSSENLTTRAHSPHRHVPSGPAVPVAEPPLPMLVEGFAEARPPSHPRAVPSALGASTRDGPYQVRCRPLTSAA